MPSAAALMLAAALPRMTEEMHRVNRLLAAGQRPEAIEQFFALVPDAIRTHREDLSCKGHVIPGRTTQISVCRIPAEPRPGKPIALFLPGLLSALPLAAVRALTFVDLFDIVLCELPGHGATGEVLDVSLAAFAGEYAALIANALPRASGLLVIGESLGGLVALALARLGRVRNVVLIDTPFQLTRPELAAWIGDQWHSTGRRAYVRRICRELMGFDPHDGQARPAVSLHEMVRGAAFGCVHLIGGEQTASGIASVVSDADVALLRAENPAMLMPPRVPGCGHAVLLDNPDGARAALQALVVRQVAGR